MPRKSFADALNKTNLPDSVQHTLLATWQETGLLDIYNGELISYFNVLRQNQSEQATRILKLESAIAQINGVTAKFLQ